MRLLLRKAGVDPLKPLGSPTPATASPPKLTNNDPLKPRTAHSLAHRIGSSGAADKPAFFQRNLGVERPDAEALTNGTHPDEGLVERGHQALDKMGGAHYGWQGYTPPEHQPAEKLGPAPDPAPPAGKTPRPRVKAAATPAAAPPVEESPAPAPEPAAPKAARPSPTDTPARPRAVRAGATPAPEPAPSAAPPPPTARKPALRRLRFTPQQPQQGSETAPPPGRAAGSSRSGNDGQPAPGRAGRTFLANQAVRRKDALDIAHARHALAMKRQGAAAKVRLTLGQQKSDVQKQAIAARSEAVRARLKQQQGVHAARLKLAADRFAYQKERDKARDEAKAKKEAERAAAKAAKEAAKNAQAAPPPPPPTDPAFNANAVLGRPTAQIAPPSYEPSPQDLAVLRRHNIVMRPQSIGEKFWNGLRGRQQLFTPEFERKHPEDVTPETDWPHLRESAKQVLATHRIDLQPYSRSEQVANRLQLARWRAAGVNVGDDYFGTHKAVLVPRDQPVAVNYQAPPPRKGEEPPLNRQTSATFHPERRTGSILPARWRVRSRLNHYLNEFAH